MSACVWKLDKDLCRCCHSEGSFHNLQDPRIILDQTEVYSEMIKSCLNIQISPIKGPYSSMTFTICEPCILKLREATNFKRQVQMCEARFVEMCRGFQDDIILKQEIPVSDDDGIKEEYSFMDEVEGDTKYDDSEDDRPIIKIKVEVPKKKRESKPITRSKDKPKIKKEKKKDKESELEKDGEFEQEIGNEEKKKNKGTWTDFSIIDDETGKLYRCKRCNKTYKRRVSFAQHYKHVHMKQRPRLFKCRLCDHKYTNRARAKHMEHVHGRQAPRCNICDKSFPHQFLLLQHQKVEHLGEKEYICEVCSDAFGTLEKLKRHMLKHSTERPFQCEFCCKSFKYKKNYLRHLDGHPRRFVCPICNESFHLKDHLNKHVEVEHPELC